MLSMREAVGEETYRVWYVVDGEERVETAEYLTLRAASDEAWTLRRAGFEAWAEEQG